MLASILTCAHEYGNSLKCTISDSNSYSKKSLVPVLQYRSPRIQPIPYIISHKTLDNMLNPELMPKKDKEQLEEQYQNMCSIKKRPLTN